MAIKQTSPQLTITLDLGWFFALVRLPPILLYFVIYACGAPYLHFSSLFYKGIEAS